MFSNSPESATTKVGYTQNAAMHYSASPDTQPSSDKIGEHNNPEDEASVGHATTISNDTPEIRVSTTAGNHASPNGLAPTERPSHHLRLDEENNEQNIHHGQRATDGALGAVSTAIGMAMDVMHIGELSNFIKSSFGCAGQQNAGTGGAQDNQAASCPDCSGYTDYGGCTDSGFCSSFSDFFSNSDCDV